MRKGHLLLTRQALAAWTRYRTAADADERRQVIAYCGLSGVDVQALDRLAANVAAAGPQEEWAVTPDRGAAVIRPEVGERLLCGVTLGDGTVQAFVRALRPHSYGVSVALQHWAKAQETRMERAEQNAIRRASIRSRLEILLQDQGIDLTADVGESQIEEWCQALDCSRGGVRSALTRIRSERGVARVDRRRRTRPKGEAEPSHGIASREPEGPEEPRSEMRGPLARLVRALVVEGVASVTPEAVRDALAVLLDALLPKA